MSESSMGSRGSMEVVQDHSHTLFCSPWEGSLPRDVPTSAGRGCGGQHRWEHSPPPLWISWGSSSLQALEGTQGGGGGWGTLPE